MSCSSFVSTLSGFSEADVSSDTSAGEPNAAGKALGKQIAVAAVGALVGATIGGAVIKSHRLAGGLAGLAGGGLAGWFLASKLGLGTEEAFQVPILPVLEQTPSIVSQKLPSEAQVLQAVQSAAKRDATSFDSEEAHRMAMMEPPPVAIPYSTAYSPMQASASQADPSGSVPTSVDQTCPPGYSLAPNKSICYPPTQGPATASSTAPSAAPSVSSAMSSSSANTQAWNASTASAASNKTWNAQAFTAPSNAPSPSTASPSVQSEGQTWVAPTSTSAPMQAAPPGAAWNVPSAPVSPAPGTWLAVPGMVASSAMQKAASTPSVSWSSPPVVVTTNAVKPSVPMQVNVPIYQAANAPPPLRTPVATLAIARPAYAAPVVSPAASASKDPSVAITKILAGSAMPGLNWY